MSITLSTGAINGMLSSNSFKDLFANGTLCIFSGSQPSNADAAETGVLIAKITESGLDFTSGVADNGLNFDNAAGGEISKVSSEVWKGDYLEDGVMGWFRFYANTVVEGESDSAIRFDGRVGINRYDLRVVTTQATLGGSLTLSDFSLNFSS